MQRLNVSLKYSLWISGLLCLSVVLYAYWRHEQRYPSTNDAYIHAHITPIAAQLTGQVKQIYVEDNQVVAQGALLFELDAKSFRLAVDKARANLAIAEQQVAALNDAVHIAAATIEKNTAQLQAIEKNYQRTTSLVSKGRAPQAEGDSAYAGWIAAKANLQVAQDEYQRAVQLRGQLGSSNAQIQLAKSQLQQVELDLQHTQIFAPSAGQISQFHLREGAVVNRNQSLFALVDINHWWVKANFKETSLDRIKPKQKVTVHVDMYPNIVFHGLVESIGAGSDTVFSIFPPENASGNWVKITQRMPVKIRLIQPSSQYPLRVGASSSVKINTQSA